MIYLSQQSISNCNDDQGYVNGWDNDTILFSQASNLGVGLSNPPKRITGLSNVCESVFGSIHQSCHILLCDGTVRSVSFTVTQSVWYSMCSINDGASFDFPEG